MSVSEHRKQIAKFLAGRLGGKASVRSYETEGKKAELGILLCEGTPVPTVSSYATVGLSEHPLVFQGKEYPVRVEFLGACRSDFKKFGEVISTAAFTVINSLGFVAPGSIIPDVFRRSQAKGKLKHLFCATPYLWEPEIPTTKFGDLTVAWIQLVPISDKEARYAEDRGPHALSKLLEEHDVDVTDVGRAEVLPPSARSPAKKG